MSARRRRTSPITGRPSAPMFPLTKPQAWRVERSRVRQERYDERTRIIRAEGKRACWRRAAISPPRPGNSLQRRSSQKNIGAMSSPAMFPPTWCIGTYSTATASTSSRIAASRARSSWPRPTCGSGPPIRRRGPTAIYISPNVSRDHRQPESIPEEIKKKIDFWSGAEGAEFIAFRRRIHCGSGI